MRKLRKSATLFEARRALETGFANLFNLAPLCLSPSEERDKMMVFLRRAADAAQEAVKASLYYEEKE